MTISYKTKRGAAMTRRIQPDALADEIAKMLKRGVECRALDDDGNQIGAVWKESGRWHWYFDTDAV